MNNDLNNSLKYYLNHELKNYINQNVNYGVTHIK